MERPLVFKLCVLTVFALLPCLALPCCHRKLSTAESILSGYPETLETIGGHIRKRRIDLNLLQREVADIFDVDKTTEFNWEAGTATPNLRTWPAVLEFLGYDAPRPSGRTVGEKLRRHREGLGLSWAEAARTMGVDPGTVSKWERQPDSRQNHISIPKIAAFLGRDPFASPASLAERIRQTRLLQGLRQREFSQILGVDQRSISEWERGERIPVSGSD